MKRILKMTAFAIVLVLGGSMSSIVSAQYNDDPYYEGGQYNDRDRDVSYQTFYDELSPHGRWVEYPGQGYVWVPDAGPDFRPYSTNGHWVYTDDYEWMWVSDYDWGWAPFHYGRWDQDPSMGWYWVPGYEWSPAWVAWRDGGDYYGWAPIRPGINISINFNIGGYAPPVDFWCFAPRRYITSPRLYDYCVDPRRNVTIINHTTIIVNNYRYSNNYGFRSGPRRYDAERHIGRINPVRFRQTYSPGRSTFRNNEVSIYRPRVRQENTRTIAPRRFDRYDANAGNRTGGNSNVFRRNDNNQVRTNDTRVPDRNINQSNPGDNRRFDRSDDRVRQQQQNTPVERKRVERNDNPDRRVFDRNNNPGNGNSENRRFEKRDDGFKQQQEQLRRNDDAIRMQQQQRDQQRRNDDAVKMQQQQREQQRRNDDAVRQQQNKRFERSDNNMGQRPQQMERKQEVRQAPQPQQQQPRKFERQENGNSGGNGKGNGNGRGSKHRVD